MAAQVSEPNSQFHQLDEEENDLLDSTKTLICALNFLSRNLPLPTHLYDAVSSIYHDHLAAHSPPRIAVSPFS